MLLLLYAYTPLCLYSSGIVVLTICLYCFTLLLLYACTPLHLYVCTPLRLYTSTPLHLYTFTPLHLYTCTPQHLQLAIYKCSREVELRAAENNISQRSEPDLNPGPVDFKSGALTTLPRCLLPTCTWNNS